VRAEGLLFRSIHGPAALDTCGRPLHGPWHGAPCTEGRRRVLALAGRWGRRQVAHLGRPLAGEPHRPRVTKVVWVERWAPEAARTSRGVVRDAPPHADAGLIQASEPRGDMAPWITDAPPRRGLGQSQPRPDGAAVTHRPLVCWASALLPHRRMARVGAPGPQTRHQAADRSTAAAHEPLRGLIWEDGVADLTAQGQGASVLAALARLRVA